MATKHQIAFFAALALVGALPGTVYAETRARPWNGEVVDVSDGDSITVLRGKKPIKIDLYGVATPELSQPFGTQARQFSSKLVLGKVVQVDPITRDRHGRPRATILGFRQLARGAKALGFYLSDELLAAGLAWWHKRSAPDDTRLAEIEAEARKAKLGLWADKNPVPPWDWRGGSPSARPSEAQGEAKCKSKADCYLKQCCCAWTALARGARQPPRCRKKCPCPRILGPRGAVCISGRCEPDWGEVVRCNTKSKVCHGSGCRHFGCESCTTVFPSMKEAVQAGYRSHAACAVARSAGRCAADRDCAIGHPRAGDCGVAMLRSEAERIRRETEKLCASSKGPREKCGPMPGCIPGRLLRRAVCRQGRCVGLTTP